MELSEELRNARAQTDSLFAAIDPAALYDRPIAERHRIVFYLGHLEAFDWNQLRGAGIEPPSIHPSFDKLFEFGIDPEPGQLPSDKPSDWPGVAEILDYNRKVRAAVDRFLPEIPSPTAHMMIEHRHMHAETFAYILHNLESAKKTGPAPVVTPCAETIPEMVEVDAGMAKLGRRESGDFGWDNEYSEQEVAVPAFSMGKYKVSNGDYLRFVNDGGPKPHYWVRRDGAWYWRGVFGEIPLPMDWPVYATLSQASAYAVYKNAKIPTEAQYHRALLHPEQQPGDLKSHNLDYRYWDPTPIRKSSGFSELIGNGWEWTSSVFAPFPGFRPSPAYPGYSANFFDGQHYVLKGASPRTAMKLTRTSLRNWFRPDYPYVYATFRLCQP